MKKNINLKEQFVRFGGNKLNEEPMYKPGFEGPAQAVNQRDPGKEMTYPNAMDIEHYSDELNNILESIDEFHQYLGTEVEMKGEETGNYEYDTMEKQLSRYINGAQKQLQSLQKYLERQKGKGL